MPTTLSYNTRPAMDSTSCLNMPCLTSMSGIRLCTHGIPTTSKYLSDVTGYLYTDNLTLFLHVGKCIKAADASRRRVTCRPLCCTCETWKSISCVSCDCSFHKQVLIRRRHLTNTECEFSTVALKTGESLPALELQS